MVKQMGKKGLIKEYAEIRARQPDGTFDHAKMRSNLTKNRYTDVLCYDHSRVVLSHDAEAGEDDDDDPTGDYINANFVDGYKQKNAYISTQGEFNDCETECNLIKKHLETIHRSTSKNRSRLLADGVGSAVFSDCDDNKDDGAWQGKMSSVLGVDGW